MRDAFPEAPTFWMNVTTSSNWHRAPVGIVRVEQELRRHLTRLLDGRLKPIVFKDGGFIPEGASLRSTGRDPDDFWPEPSYGSSVDVFDLMGAPAAERADSSRPPANPGKPSFGHGDVLITLGLDWDYPGLHNEIRRLARAYNLTVVTCCYDLIPIIFPQYCVGDVASWFKDYIIDMTWSADCVLCISENTRDDYLALARAIGLPPRRTEVIKLGSSLPPQIDGPPISKEVARVLEGRFFLFVSTIERRKNHEVLYRAYHLLRRDYPAAEFPKLVFVGMEGWGVGDLMADVRLDPLTKEDIVVLPHVSDSELLLLYGQCEVFLYPSLYEGWGLPIAEALQLGRPVLASNSGSIPEVGGDLVRYLDPWSPRAWADELLKIANGEIDLESWSRKIAETFTPCEWSSAARTLIATATELRRTKPSTQVLEPGYDLSTLHGVHYGERIIYKGRQGIVCHGPYIELASGNYLTTIEIDWLESAPGSIRFVASHESAEFRLATKEIDTRSLPIGRHEIVLQMQIPEPVCDFQLVCEVDCLSEIKVSVNRLEISRVEASATQRPAAEARALA